MVSFGDVLEWVLVYRLVITFEVGKEGFFVREMPMTLHVIMDFTNCYVQLDVVFFFERFHSGLDIL